MLLSARVYRIFFPLIIVNTVRIAKMARLILLALMIVLVPIVTSLTHSVFAETYTNRPPILIAGNDGFTADNGVTGGTGTSDDPYVISGWALNVQVGSYGIEITDTTAYFIISDDQILCGVNNCGDGILLFSIENSQVQSTHINVQGDGIRINTSNNFLIDNSNIIAGGNGIRVDDSDNFQITANHIHGSGGQNSGGAECFSEGVIFLSMSSSFDVSNNSLEGGPFAIKGCNLSDATIVGNTGGAEDGIDLDNIASLLISQNSLRAHVSIAVASCGDVTIDGNNATAHDTGISVGRCEDVMISNNIASAPSIDGVGVSIGSSDRVTLTSNTISNNQFTGIFLANSATGNTISDNLIGYNKCGITTDSTSPVDQNNIADNTFIGNAQDFCAF